MLNGVQHYKPKDNAFVLNAARRILSNTYQDRIPKVDQGNITQTIQRLLDNAPLWNEFSEALVNRVGLEIFIENNWSNPLKLFKRGRLEHGSTVEEIAVDIAQGYTYDANREYLEKAIFGQHRADVRAAYHKINLQRYYPITINRDILRRAFNDDFALSNHIQQIMVGPSNADELDEFAAMVNLFPEYHAVDGFFKVNVPDVGAKGSDEATAKSLLRTIREYMSNIAFLSPHYNAARIHSHAKREKIVIFTTPAVNAALDVEALAQTFNLSKAEVPARIIEIPAHEFRIPGIQAIVTTEDFFVVVDSLYDVTRADNPVGLYENHFIHHHQVISASPFVPAILLWTGEGDTIDTIETPVEGVDPDDIELLGRDGPVTNTVQRGDTYQITGRAITDGSNDAVTLTLSGVESPRTYLTRSTLYVGADESSDSLTITATSTDDADMSASLTLNVDGDFWSIIPPVYSEGGPADDKDAVTVP